VTRQESRLEALALAGQLGTSEGVLVDLVGCVGEAQRPVHGERPRERDVLIQPARTVHLDGLVEDPLDGTGRGDLDGLDLGGAPPCCRRCP
jgi:hypothetical protein